MQTEHDQAVIESVYRDLPLTRIPWNIPEPPAALVALLESGAITPCTAIDLGCGAGNHATYLASRGFTVTGVDRSPAAIRLARQLAAEKGVSCRFVVADLLGALPELAETFAFAYDWELLHHIYPAQRETYVANVYRLLQAGGRYLSVCFSEQDRQFGGAGTFRTTPLGTVLYFSSEDELRRLFEKYFTIIELKTIECAGKSAPHLVNYLFMQRD